MKALAVSNFVNAYTYRSGAQAFSQTQFPNQGCPNGELAYAENVSTLFPQDPV